MWLDGIVDTVGDLREALARFDPDLPITAHYDGTGRTSVVLSLVDDVDYCLAIAEAGPDWLARSGLDLTNPKVKSEVPDGVAGVEVGEP